MAVTSPMPTGSPHVPAWKRLGLKLKYANDSPRDPVANPSSVKPATPSQSLNPASKRAASDDGLASDTTAQVASKRCRTGPREASKLSTAATPTSKQLPAVTTTSTQAIPQKRSYGFGSANSDSSAKVTARHTKFDADDDTIHPADTVAPKPIQTKTPSTKRKSVSFTPETKAEDGFSAQSLFEDWLATKGGGEEDYDIQKVSNPPPPAQQETQAVTSNKKKRGPKRDGQSEAVDISDQGVEITEYLRYLRQYYNDRQNWKFNKNQQQKILRHIFDLKRVPAQDNDALVDYISGLQGASARQRLLDEAENVLKALLEKQDRSGEIDGMGTPAERRAAYQAAFEREYAIFLRGGSHQSEYDQKQLQDLRWEKEKAERADAVLHALLSHELNAPAPHSVSVAEPETTAELSALPAATSSEPLSTKKHKVTGRKKRKVRTKVSSDEDSSSSDESSESEGE